MTVHASQGRTRKNNVCNLSNCINHLAYYTALSRSSLADDTIILQGFDPKKIQGGITGYCITGYLRQEFRELEILNEITRLKYTNSLSSNINRNTRSILIQSFYKNKPILYLPKDIPKELLWDSKHSISFPDISSNFKQKTSNKFIE